MPEVRSLDDIDHALKVVVSSLASVRENVKDRVLATGHDGLVVHTRLQVTFGLKFQDPLRQSIHEIIVGHAYAAERLGPGGFDACLSRVLEKLGSSGDGNHGMPPAISLDDLVGTGALAPVRPDVDWALGMHLVGVGARTRAMLHTALDLAGFAGRISVEKARARPSVELVRGYAFDQAPAWPIVASVRLERPRVVCIDGYVEAVSELHHLLEAAAEAKEPVLLFARGMSDEVKHTLKVNYDRGSLRVVPIVVKFDLAGINAVNDVAVAAGCRLVSSNLGDLISSVRLADAPRVDEAIVHPTRVVINNVASRRAVEVHVAQLRKKRLDEKVDDVALLYDNRIKALSPNHVIIRLPDDKDYVASAQAIDYALRAIRALVDHGTVVVDGERLLTVTALAADVHSRKCLATLATLGAVVRP